MLATARVPVEDKTSGELHAELAEIGARLMVETLAQLDQLKPEPQPELGATYAAKIDKAEARIDWSQARRADRARGARLRALPRRVVRARRRADQAAQGARDRGQRRRRARCSTTSSPSPAATPRSARSRSSARASRRWAPAEFLRGKPVPVGTVLAVTRFALTLEFDGGPFMGLQRQDHGPSVQEAVERAVLEVTGETVTMHSAGPHRQRGPRAGDGQPCRHRQEARRRSG